MGPDELVRLAFVARQHFLEGKTRIEIAEDMNLSRFKVGRMLDEAIAHGIIKFELATPELLDLDLSLKLQEKFGLKHALAVIVPTQAPETIQEYLGTVAGQLLGEILKETDVLGLTAGRTLSAMARSLQSLPRCEVVQLAGIAGPIQETGVEVIRRVSRVAGGRPWSIYAPLVVSDPSTADAILRQLDMRRTFEQFDRVTVAVVAVGSWSPPDSQMYDNAAITPELRDRLLAKGARAEICATLVDDRGSFIGDIDERTVAISSSQLRKIPEVIAVAGGELKTGAVRAALSSGLIDSLVTDAVLAQKLIGDTT